MNERLCFRISPSQAMAVAELVGYLEGVIACGALDGTPLFKERLVSAIAKYDEVRKRDERDASL